MQRDLDGLKVLLVAFKEFRASRRVHGASGGGGDVKGQVGWVPGVQGGQEGKVDRERGNLRCVFEWERGRKRALKAAGGAVPRGHATMHLTWVLDSVRSLE